MIKRTVLIFCLILALFATPALAADLWIESEIATTTEWRPEPSATHQWGVSVGITHTILTTEGLTLTIVPYMFTRVGFVQTPAAIRQGVGLRLNLNATNIRLNIHTTTDFVRQISRFNSGLYWYTAPNLRLFAGVAGILPHDGQVSMTYTIGFRWNFDL